MAQSLDYLLVHIIFSTKNRESFLADQNIRDEMYAVMASSFKNQESPAHIIGGTADHVHVLIRLSKNHALAKVIGVAKRATSTWIKDKGDEYKKFAWQAGYAAFSVSASLEEKVQQYILDQEAHHTKQSLQDEMRTLFHKHDVEFDERYVWD